VGALKWEPKFASWAKAPRATELEKCAIAEAAVRKAIGAHPALAALDISVFAHGSYKARTNIRVDGDVDVFARLNSAVFTAHPDGSTTLALGVKDGIACFSHFKSLLEDALTGCFGADCVARGDKAFGVHAGTRRVNADVTPVFLHRRRDRSGAHIDGVAFDCDSGKHIINWPEQTLASGARKNENTSRRYKRVVRVLKRLRDEMRSARVPAAKNAPSFLLESLVWNAPDEAFSSGKYHTMLRAVLAHAFYGTQSDEACANWGEVSNLKYLFRLGQPWKRATARAFVSAAWDFAGYVQG
jgi:hypothetical protein